MPLPRREHWSLCYDRPLSAAEILERLIVATPRDMPVDVYGEGRVHQDLEARLRDLLGVEGAMFLPTGRLAQLITLAVWSERRGSCVVGLHPRCHLEEHEERAYQHVLGQRAVPFGSTGAPYTPEDVDRLPGGLAVAMVEVPLLDLDCRMPDWGSLVDISARCRSRGLPLHGDLARGWEAAAGYGRTPKELVSLFDTAYLSFYKGLCAFAGAVLVGPADFVAEARVWRRRFGGDPFRQFPVVLDALRALDQNLPLIPRVVARARELAALFAAVPGVRVTPNPPHINAFRVLLPGNPARLREAADEVAHATGLRLFQFASPPGIDGLAAFNVTTGSAALEVPDAVAVESLRLLVQKLAS